MLRLMTRRARGGPSRRLPAPARALPSRVRPSRARPSLALPARALPARTLPLRTVLVCALLIPAGTSAAAAAAPPSLATLDIPGDPAFAAVARDILAVRFALDPSIAAGDGLVDDAARVPSFDADTVAARIRRLDAALQTLLGMPWRNWEIDRQIDWRWMYASAEDARLQLAEEKLYLHRPASWFEPLANTYVALLTYAPERADLRARLTRAVPEMVAEMRRVAATPTARDVDDAADLAAGILTTLASEPPGAEREAAAAALTAYVDRLESLTGLPECAVIGADRYAARLRRALLLPWSPQQLLALSQRALTEADAAMAELRPRLQEAAPATPGQIELAGNLDQKALLALYDEIVRADRAFLDSAGLVTIPAAVGPILARPTPEPIIPLSGDGGSMNPAPPIGGSNVGWWNVEHVPADWSMERRADRVVSMQGWQRTGMGPYAVHEGVPGHHLQLSLARLHPNPLRNLLGDTGFIEGWAMYAEEMFWRAGGLGDSPDAEFATVRSWRGRIRRVFYDVHVECGDWTLQEAADFRAQVRRGRGEIDNDVLRAINWPAQLICYFAGKMQILELREAWRRKLGPEYTDRKFHDALLAEGSIPVALIRAKLLGEDVPEP